MKRIASIILILAMIMSCLPMQVWADESEVLELPALEASVEPETVAASDDDLSWSLTNDGVLTVSGTGSMNSNIPWSAFSAQIRKVVLEEGVTTVANSAFYECYNLAEVILPDSLTTIGYSAFYKCTSLTSITIPVGVTKINSDVFWGCNSLEQIIVADDNATYSSDDRGVLYNKDKTVLHQAPWALSGSYEIPDSVVAIKDNAFANCSIMTAVTIPDTVVDMGSSAFANCDALTEVTIPGSVIAVKEGMFSDCDGLKEVIMEKGVVSIDSNVFHDCNVLEHVDLPRTLTAIGTYAFAWCNNLKSITIPDSVLYIDNEAFYDCETLNEVWFRGNAPGFGRNCFSYMDATIYYPAGDATWTDEIFNASYGSNTNLKWESYVKTEEPEDEEQEVYVIAWGYCGKTATWQVTSDGVLTISGNGEMNFSITRSVGASAPWLAYVDQISTVVVEKGITSIADAAFADCTGVETVEIADTVTSIGSEAFAGCENLAEVTFCGDLPELGEDCFGGESVTVYYPEENDTWTQDVIESLGESVDLVPYQFQAGDFNGDLAVDDGDVAYLLWHTLFPELYPL